MWWLFLLLAPAWGADLTLDPGAAISDTPIPVDEVTVSWTYSPTDGTHSFAATVGRLADSHGTAVLNDLLQSARQVPAATDRTVVYTDDSGTQLTVTLQGAQLTRYQCIDPGTPRAGEQIDLVPTGVAVTVSP